MPHDVSPETELQQITVPEALTEVKEESQITVHISLQQAEDFYIRIWPSTFLIDRQHKTRARLLQQFDISKAPQWTFVPAGRPYRFTLIFERLPTDCVVFDLQEIIPEPGGFIWTNILRNKQDVYWLRLD